MFSFDEVFGKAGQHQAEHTVAKVYKLAGRQIKEEKLISEGAFGYIWRAVDTRSGEVFALKRVICTNAQRLEAARHELEVMKKMKPCPNLVGFYGGDLVRETASKTIVIVLMEMCDTGTLFDELVSKQEVGFKQAHLLRIIESIAKGIASLHSIGYAHRDIKIQNVLQGKDGGYKLCDFGSCTNQTSEYANYEDELERNTTPMYRPPEIVDPFLKYRVSEKVDVWMLGCVLYTLCYFVHPFIESNKLAISRGIFKIPTDGKYKHSNKINDLIRHMLTPNPKNRPSIADVLQIIRDWPHLHEVPLNVEAKALKLEQERKAKELEALDQKAVHFDGDIPLDELMKLQKKLQKQTEAPVTSFVKPKPTVHKASSFPTSQPISNTTAPLKHAQSTKQPQQNSDFDFFNFSGSNTKPEPKPSHQPLQHPPPATKPSANLDLWNLLSDPLPKAPQPSPQPKPTVSASNQFDIFASLAPVQKPQKKAPSSSTDFDMFTGGFQRPPSKPAPPSDFNFF